MMLWFGDGVKMMTMGMFHGGCYKGAIGRTRSKKATIYVFEI